MLIDALNVMRSRWPHLAADRVMALISAWAERNAAHAVVVFDGRAPGGIVGERVLDERTTIVGTAGRSADDWIAEQAEQLAAEGRRPWLVTSDRELRARTAAHTDRVLGGGGFAATLLEMDRRD